MPNIASAAKAMRSSERKRMRNKSVKSALKTFLSKAEKLISSGEMGLAGEAVVKIVRALDKAAEKGIIHANKAARHKSRLMKKLNAALSLAAAAASPSPAELEPTPPKRRSRRAAPAAVEPTPAKRATRRAAPAAVEPTPAKRATRGAAAAESEPAPPKRRSPRRSPSSQP